MGHQSPQSPGYSAVPDLRCALVCVPCSEVSGNAHLVAHRILEKLPQDDRCALASSACPALVPHEGRAFLECTLRAAAPVCCSPRRRVSYSQERHLFHIVVKDGITFLCMADEVIQLLPVLACSPASLCTSIGCTAARNLVSSTTHWPVGLQELGRRIPFAFLEDIKDRCWPYTRAPPLRSACKLLPCACSTPWQGGLHSCDSGRSFASAG